MFMDVLEKFDAFRLVFSFDLVSSWSCGFDSFKDSPIVVNAGELPSCTRTTYIEAFP